MPQATSPATVPTPLAAMLDATDGLLAVYENGAPAQPPRRRRQRAPIDRAVRRLVYERDGHACRTCGDRDRLVLDHVIPHARGGSDDATNLRTLCWDCNAVRSDQPDAMDRPGPQRPVTEECDQCATTPDADGYAQELDPDATTVLAYCGSCGTTSPTDRDFVL